MNSDLVKRLAILGLLGLGLSACSSLGTSVAEDDPETEIPNLSMGRAIMEGLGAVPTRTAPINFTPRAPLVVPPSTTALTAPESPNQVASLENWPDDPDVAAARRLREAAARDAARDDPADPVSGSELLSSRVQPAPRQRIDPRADPARPLMPSQLAGFKSTGATVDGLYDAAGQPRRRALVEPPVEYLQPAAGAPVAIPVPPKKKGILDNLKFW
jgi:hypothetical protein